MDDPNRILSPEEREYAIAQMLKPVVDMFKNFGVQRELEEELTALNQKSSKASKAEREKANYMFKNQHHSKIIHKEILSKYSKSAALAPKGSEELVSAISNRSVFLLHIKKYQNCINDIDYALSMTVSAALKSKLLSRKVVCLLALNKNNDAKNVFKEACKSLECLSKEDEKMKNNLLQELNNAFKKSYGKIKEIKKEDLELKNFQSLPYISESVSFTTNPKFGKHLIANRDIKTGEILFAEETYCVYPELKELYVVCSHCLRFTFNSIPCDNCVFAVYCSKTCQESAFEKYHNIECSLTSSVFKYKFSNHPIFMCRLFLLLLKDIGVKDMIKEANFIDKNKDEINNNFNNSHILSNNYNAFYYYYGLFNQNGLKRDNVDEKFPKFFLNLLKKNHHYSDDLNTENIKILEKIFIKLMHNQATNAFQCHMVNFEATEDDFLNGAQGTKTVGDILSPLSNFINHNCYPNADRFYTDGVKFFAFANRPIKKNQQIYFTYGPSIQQSKGIRESMIKHHKFECNCPACVGNWPDVDALLMQSIQRQAYQGKYQDFVRFKTMGFNPSFNERFDLWTHDKKTIKQLCKIIDDGCTKLSVFEGAIATCEFKTNLWRLFSIVYNHDIGIPDAC